MHSFLIVDTLKKHKELGHIPKPYTYFAKSKKYYKLNKAFGHAEQIKGLPVRGIHLELPLSKSELEEFTQEEIRSIIMRHLDLLKQEHFDVEVAHSIKPDLQLRSLDFPFLNKSVTDFLTANLLLENMLLHMQKPISEIKVAIIGGDVYAVKGIIKQIYSYVNYITAVIHEPEELQDLCTEIYEDCGLVVATSQDVCQDSIGRADVIFNMSTEPHHMYHLLQSGTMIYDFVSNTQLIGKIMQRRKDVKVIKGYSLELSGQCIRTIIFDMLLYIQYPHAYNYLRNGDYEKLFPYIKQIQEYVTLYNAKIKKLEN